ncbi:MAG: response regulator [Rhodothermales bacterium]
MKKKVLIVDDHPLMRKGLALTLSMEGGLDVCAQAESAEEALEKLEESNPDVAVIDISLPGMSGLELIKHLQVFNPGLKIIVVSRHDEALYAERAIRAGARGYIMKLEAGEVIVEAVNKILMGGIYVSPEINERLLMGMLSGKNTSSNSPFELLSDRELEVFELTGHGIATREIAERLHLSVKTVESYRARIKNKLDLQNATELLQHAIQWVEGANTH